MSNNLNSRTIAATEFSIRGKPYRVEVWPSKWPGKADELVWTAFRRKDGYWEKIPAMTRAEERAFPKTVGYRAYAFLLETQNGQLRLALAANERNER